MSHSPNTSHTVWLAGSAMEIPEAAYYHSLAAAGHELHWALFTGDFFENLANQNERFDPPTAVIVESTLARRGIKRLRSQPHDNEDIAPAVPRLLREAGIEVPTIYVQGETPVDIRTYLGLGYTAIVAPNPDVDARVAAAVHVLRYL